MGRTAQQRAWSKYYLNVTIIPSGEIEQVITSWELLGRRAITKLEKAISLAPVMVKEAIEQLNEHLVHEHPTRSVATLAKWHSNPENPDHSEVGQALVKYFRLHYRDRSKSVSPNYWKYVRGIITVYQKIAGGLGSPYELVIGYFDDKARVAGRGKIQKDVSEIRQTFGFVDEWGHSAWRGYERAGRIQLSWNYLDGIGTTELQIARTLVHEASHKWAGTKDILYKHDTFAQTGATDDDEQEKIRLPGRNKPLLPMTGFVGKTSDLVTAESAERLLENADSYAWAARRLWKRSLSATV